MYTIKKVLNSSVVLGENNQQQEYILLGKGIGFGKKSGDIVLEQDISQVFIPVEDGKIQQFLDDMSIVSPKLIDIMDYLVKQSKDILELDISHTIYFALLDHMQFAIERYHNDMIFTNKVYWEIKTYYPKEFQVGESVVEELNKIFDIKIPIEEAANIAFHLINAQAKPNNNKGQRYAKLVGEIVNLTQYTLGIDIQSRDVYYTRFVTHIKFFVERYLDDFMLDSDNEIMFDNISSQFPKSMEAAYTINEYLKKTYRKPITTEELLYLAIHFNRLLQ